MCKIFGTTEAKTHPPHPAQSQGEHRDSTPANSGHVEAQGGCTRPVCGKGCGRNCINTRRGHRVEGVWEELYKHEKGAQSECEHTGWWGCDSKCVHPERGDT